MVKKNRIVMLVLAAAVLAVVTSGIASAATVNFQNPICAQLYDDNGQIGGFNAAWVSFTQENVNVAAGDTLQWATTSTDLSTKVQPNNVSVINYYICNGLSQSIGQDNVGYLNSQYGSQTTLFDSKSVSSGNANNFQISVGYYPRGSSQYYFANPMKTNYLQ